VQRCILGDEGDTLESLERAGAKVSSTVMLPFVAVQSPTAQCSNVVLPAPFGPTRATMRPAGTARLQSRRAQVLR
jgi:hypothetical protein